MNVATAIRVIKVRPSTKVRRALLLSIAATASKVLLATVRVTRKADIAPSVATSLARQAK